MRIGFLTPMKSPDHTVPSGDRTFARLIVTALERAGHTVRCPSRFVTWRPTPEGLDALLAEAGAEIERIAAEWRLEGAPDVVLTYHNYHKAPDLLGPTLAARFGLPYAIVEASRAPKQAAGPWGRHFALADIALASADVVAAVTRHDHVELERYMPRRLEWVPAFIDTRPFLGERRPPTGNRLVSAAMMREGRKADSLRVLADAFGRLTGAAELVIAGDGAARPALEPLFPPGTFVGLLDQPALAALLRDGDLFVWPALDEPFGFAFLEAQAAGLPVVGGAAPGVADVVRDGETGLLVEPGDPAAFAEAIDRLLADPPRRVRMGKAARAFAGEHDIDVGAARLDALVTRAVAHRLSFTASGLKAVAPL
ncbi:glycosyltransferase family 4 protein [Acuticoccus sp. M5D2P5]|uniref:glycosyltransferase family 4 protein n=1 Tax=Acuticoccus kalidii TaxID=2910977 RepID=UPI001F417D60|nr:glycosyltransferase family 4 protein [Acuticoccus kalidii]MCF3932308.1 glycosyltransferase family 4 protein [Acuticoccus kalidii]